MKILRRLRWRSPRDLEEEIQAHIELEMREKVREGLTPEEARHAALRSFGNPTRAHERAREADLMYWWDTLAQNVLYSFRLFRKNPVFTATAVVTLALGLGANTTLFSIAYQTLLRPLPYPQPQQLLWVSDEFLGAHRSFVPHPTFFAWREQNRTCAKIAAFIGGQNLDLTEAGPPQRILAASLSSDFFPLLGIRPALGRNFSIMEETPHGPRVVILDHALWTERFGANSQIVGQSVHLNAKTYTVIGVLPAGIELPIPGPRTQVFLPLQYETRWGPQSAGIAFFSVLARLKPGMTPAAAAADFWSIEKRVLLTYPKFFSRFTHSMRLTVVPLQEQLTGKVRPGLLLLLAVTFFVLLIACANVAHLQLVRALARQQEFAIRTALGGGTLRLASQLLLESLLLATLGGTFGIVFARLSLSLLRSLVPATLIDLHTSEIYLPVLLFSFALALLVGLLTGLAPILMLSSVHGSLQASSPRTTGSRQRHTLSHLLIAGEIGVALLLLIASALLLKSFLHMTQAQLGFDPNQLLTAKISLPDTRYPDLVHQSSFFQQILQRLQRLPGVRSAAITTDLPFSGLQNKTRLVPAGRSVAEHDVSASIAFAIVSPDYFRTMRIPLQAGRVFTERDGTNAPLVAIANQAFVQRFFEGGNVLGRRLESPPGARDSEILTIVGVVGNVQHQFPAEPPAPEVFFPLSQHQTIYATVVLRTQENPLSLGSALQHEVFALDASQPVYDLLPMRKQLANASHGERFHTVGVAAFAGLALLLAAVGIYGVVSYAVSQRTREIGVRMALGAGRSQIVQMVVWRTLPWVFTGILTGGLLALAFTRYLHAFLWQVKPNDPIVLAGASLFLIGVASVACWVPAARAARIEPMEVLREV